MDGPKVDFQLLSHLNARTASTKAKAQMIAYCLILYSVVISPAASNYHRFYIADKSFVASDIAMLYQVGENGLNLSTLKNTFQ